MKTEHAPGPWRVAPDILADAPYYSRRSPDSDIHDCFIETLTPVRMPFAGVSGQTLEECQANARLIASAPDLLAALKAIVSAASREIIIAGRHKRSEGEVLIEKARAVIRKATEPA